MCDDHVHAPDAVAALPRRRVLQGMVALAALAGVGIDRSPAAAAPLLPRAQSVDGLNAYALAMHLHASASEGVGSVRSQLAQAAVNGFDVAWFNEHDWRRHRTLFRTAYHFLARDVEDGGRWRLTKLADAGSLTSTSGALLVTSPVSPNDPGGGAVRLRATSTGSSVGTMRCRVNADGGSRANFRARIAGRTVSVDVLPTKSGVDGWAEVSFRLSHHPATGGRPAGVYTLLYRLRTDIAATTTTPQGITAVIDVPVVANQWGTVTFDLTQDAAVAWPDVAAEDNSLSDIELHAASQRRFAGEVFFSCLRFAEKVGYDPLLVESTLLAGYASQVPSLLALNGTEISLGPHLNQYGGPQTPFDYGSPTSLSQDLGEIRPAIVQHIHAQQGLASINHPFKPGDTGTLPTAAAVATDLLQIGAGGADLLEVGYANRNGGSLTEHLAVWDTLSRNGLYLTSNGVSDDHTGQNWASQSNRFYTAAWAAEKTESSLLSALAAGRGYVGYLGGFTGTVDMDLDGAVRMGQVLVNNTSATRTLNVQVTNVPTGGAVQVVRGVVDPQGTADPTPSVTVRTLPANSTTYIADTGDDCFHRLQVVNPAGAVVAFGQPIWTYAGTSPTAVPAPRQATV